MSPEQIKLCVDRLTRFKHPRIKYNRVFSDLILSQLIEPKINKKTLETLDNKIIVAIVEEIFNSSTTMPIDEDEKFCLNKMLIDFEEQIYKIDEQTRILMNAKLNCKGILEDFIKSRYPVEKIIIAEGITEEILIPTFADILDCNLQKNNVYLIGAGGKNQVTRMYFEFLEQIKIPIIILFDNDAAQLIDIITPRLRKKDEIILIKKGEFEDLLPLELIKKTLDNKFKNQHGITIDELKSHEPMTKILHNLHKKKGWGEYKKAEFAHSVKENLERKDQVSQEIKDIIYKMINRD